MQFKCSSCQAKYQIADEKVAGKTVRMKCRKCGAPIEVRAKVTDAGLVAVPVGSGESAAAPSVAAPAAPSVAAPAAPSVAAPSVAAPAAPSVAAPAAPSVAAPAAPAAPSVAAPAAPSVAAPAAPAAPPKRVVPPPRKPAEPGAPPPKKPPEPGAKPLGVAPGLRPFAPAGTLRPVGAEQGDEDGGATTILSRDLLGVGVGKGPSSIEASERKPPPAAGRRPTPVPAAAPTPAPARPEPSPPAASAGPGAPPPAEPSAATHDAEEAEEWFVGIGGRPVGPKPREFLAERLATGEIDANSLVWREDFTDWRKLGTVADLAPLLSTRAGSAAPAVSAPQARDSADSSASGAVASRPEPSAPSKGPSVPPPAPSAPVALVRVKDEDAVAFDQGPAVLAASAASARAEHGPSLGPPGATEAAPRARHGVAAAPADEAAEKADAAGPVSEQDDEAGRSRRERRRRSRGVKPVAWAFVAMAGAFGAVAAYVVFVEPPGARGGGPDAALTPGSTPATGAPTDRADGPGVPTGPHSTILLDPVSVAPTVNGTSQPVAVGTGAASPGGSAERPSDLDLSGFNTAGPSGPTAGPGPTAGSESRGELTSADISAVVAKYKGGVSRKCLPLVEAGGAGGATSARVVAHLLIGPSGDVQSASASGGKEFPGLADCVAARVRTWKFPPSSGTTPVDVPFHFIAQ